MCETVQELINSSKSAFYTFDIKLLNDRINFIRSHLPKDVSICYAVKANPFIVKEICDKVERLEICSPGEAKICKDLEVPDNKQVISGVYKTPQVMIDMLEDKGFNGIFTVESMGQYELFKNYIINNSSEIRLLLRLTNGSQFGINEEDIEQIISENNMYPDLHIVGIQYFSGTQKTSLKKYKREIEKLDALLLNLKEKYNFVAEELEYGTGFPFYYFESDENKEIEILDGFAQLIMQMKSNPKIILEIGRGIAASCGKYYTHIVDLKRNDGQNYALVEGGMHHLVYFGQHMAMKKPFFFVVNKEVAEHNEVWTICGSLCSMNDIVLKQVELPDIVVGDILCFENTGAYCMTEGIALFLSRDLPAVYLLMEDGSIKCVRETYETYRLNMPEYGRN